MGCGASTATNETIAVYDDRLGNMWLDDRRFPAPEMADGNTTYHNWGGLNKQGETSLVLASKEGDPRAVEWILGQASAPGDFSQQFVIDEPNTEGQAPLLAAAQRGHLTICETLHLRSLLRAASEARDAELASAATGGQGGQGARPRGAGFDGDGDLFCAVHALEVERFQVETTTPPGAAVEVASSKAAEARRTELKALHERRSEGFSASLVTTAAIRLRVRARENANNRRGSKGGAPPAASHEADDLGLGEIAEEDNEALSAGSSARDGTALEIPTPSMANETPAAAGTTREAQSSPNPDPEMAGARGVSVTAATVVTEEALDGAATHVPGYTTHRVAFDEGPASSTFSSLAAAATRGGDGPGASSTAAAAVASAAATAFFGAKIAPPLPGVSKRTTKRGDGMMAMTTALSRYEDAQDRYGYGGRAERQRLEAKARKAAASAVGKFGLQAT